MFLTTLIGYQLEAWVGATGTAVDAENKKALVEAQLDFSIEKAKIRDSIEVLNIQM